MYGNDSGKGPWRRDELDRIGCAIGWTCHNSPAGPVRERYASEHTLLLNSYSNDRSLMEAVTSNNGFNGDPYIDNIL